MIEQQKGRVKLTATQIEALRITAPIILKQEGGVMSDKVLEDLKEVGINPVEAMEAMLNIHPTQIPPLS